MTNYGKIDVLWYDVPWPLSAEGWESVKMNQMVRKLQPDVIINNRSKVPEDFDTPEQRIEASKGRNWEACMTMNDSWGYHKTDDNWKSAKTCIRNLITCARQGGNYLLNIGPMADGAIPPQSIDILTEVGDWLSRNGKAIYDTDPCQPGRSEFMRFTRKGNTLYAHIYYWPGETAAIGGLRNKVLSARFLATGKPVKFDQDEFRVRLSGLPANPPDRPLTSFELQLDGEPKQDMDHIRIDRPRRGV
jgi:alpha-L-fucosidase